MRLGVKIMLCFIVLLSMTFGIGGSLLITASFDNALGRAEQSALDAHRLLLYTLAAVNAGTDDKDETLISTLEQLDGQRGRSWTALRLSDGRNTLFMSKGVPGFDESMRRGVGPELLVSKISRTESGDYVFLVAGQFNMSGGSRFLESAYDFTPLYEARFAQELIYRRVFAAVIVLGATVSWLVSYILTRPLSKLSDVSRHIASGDLSCRASESGNDEIRTLAVDFNNMTDRLRENITELTDSMHRQEEFIGGFAHELKTPMTSIIGYADLLRSHELSERERREAANYIFTEGRRLEVLSLKLLDLIVLKRRDFTLVPASISQIVAEVVRLLKPVTVRLGIAVRYRCDEGRCMLEPDLVKSLLLNLCDNARKALDKGGEIVIEARLVSDGCVLRVGDNGKGIPASELERITDAFYRVDKSRSRAQGGVGLGLALCSEIAALHNGSLSFDSIVGQGTVVTVTLKGGSIPCED